jgi:hypothetical protein
MVPELAGLVPDASQEQLAPLLAHVGQSCMELLQHTPNLGSHEIQLTTQRTVSRVSQGAFHPVFAPERHERQQFEYLLLRHETEGGTELREYRTDKHGQPIQYSGSQAGQMTQGFISEWLRLLPGGQREARFRYLGREEVENRKTLVLAFAQIPGQVKYPTSFSFPGIQVALLVQGIVWVDDSDFRIVRIVENLLAPRPDIQLSKLSTSISFGSTTIQKAAMSLWVPREVTIAWEYKGDAVEQRHSYSNYHLYEVKSRILLQ